MGNNSASSIEFRNAIREAARWYAILLSPDVNATDQQQWQDWLKQTPHNRLAWQEVEQVQAKVNKLPSEVTLPSLRGAALSRRDLLRRLSFIALAAPVGWMAWRTQPWQTWQAQYATAIGEQQQFILADGGNVILNTATALDVLFTTDTRLIKLYKGEIRVQTAPDNHTPTRPFIVETSHGRIEALGTRFMVRIDNNHTDVTVLNKTVRITPKNAAQYRDIKAGQQLSFTTSTLGPIEPVDNNADSWVNGSLIVVDMPLGKLLAELSRYRRGILSCSDDIADLKISGAFPVKDTDRALAAITRAFPLNQIRRTQYWVHLIPI